MPTGKMHADEVDTDASLVGRLLAAQFPRWADLPIRPVPSAGTVPLAMRDTHTREAIAALHGMIDADAAMAAWEAALQAPEWDRAPV